MKQEEINIADILRNMPKGTPLYSPVCGALLLDEVTSNGIFCVQPKGIDNGKRVAFMEDGHLKNYGNWADGGECVLYPSLICRDWNAFLFEDGEYIAIDYHYSNGGTLTYVCLFKRVSRDMKIITYAALNVNGKELDVDMWISFQRTCYEERQMTVRLATQDEQDMFKESMAKEGYAWCKKAKDFYKKFQCKFRPVDEKFKPFDKVQVRVDDKIYRGMKTCFDRRIDDKVEREFMRDPLLAYTRAFGDAISWFRKILWHDVSEEPDKSKSDIVTLGFDNEAQLQFKQSVAWQEELWRHSVSRRRIKQWCYLSDLFPEGGGL